VLDLCPIKCDESCGAVVTPPPSAPPTPQLECIEDNVCTQGSKVRPSSLLLRYVPGAFIISQQGSKASVDGSVSGQLSYITCTDGVTAVPNTAIDVNDVIELFPGTSAATPKGGGTSEPRFAASTTCVLYASQGRRQDITFHTSCSVPLKVDDIFGSLTMVGYNGTMQCQGEEARVVATPCTDPNVCTAPALISLELMYTPGQSSSNSQGLAAYDQGDASVGMARDIICVGDENSGHHFSDVPAGDTVVVGHSEDSDGTYLGADLSCTIFSNGSKIEQIRISTSCSVPLVVGDIFGSLTVVGYNDLTTVCNPTCYACPTDAAALGGVGLKTLSFNYTGGDTVSHSLPAGSVTVAGGIYNEDPVFITVVTGAPERIIGVYTNVVLGQSISIEVPDTDGTVSFFMSSTTASSSTTSVPLTSTAAVTTVTPADVCEELEDANPNETLTCSTRGINFPDSCALSIVRHHCPRSCCTYGYAADYTESSTGGPILAMVTIDVTCGTKRLSMSDSFGALQISAFSHTDDSTGTFSLAEGCAIGTSGPTVAPMSSAPTSAPSSSCFDMIDGCPFIVLAGGCEPTSASFEQAKANCARSCGFCMTVEDQLIADINGTVVSAMTCDELEAVSETSVWKTMGSSSSDQVCGASKNTAGVCFGDFTFGPELRQCFDIGARSCTMEEIEQGEAATTACGASGKFTWTSTACSNAQGVTGLYLYNKDTSTTECATPDSSSVGMVQCCADHPVVTSTAAGNVANNNANQQSTLGADGTQGLTIAAFVLIAAVIAVVALVALLKRRQKRDDADVNTTDGSTAAASSVSSRDNSRRYPTLDGPDDDSFSIGTTALDRSEHPNYDRATGPAPWEWMDMLRDGDGLNTDNDFGPAYSSLDVRTTSFASVASQDDVDEEPAMEDVTYDLASKATEKQGINLKSWDLYSRAAAGGGQRDAADAVYSMASPGGTGEDALEWDGAF
jgi:hypothetical protein